MYLTEQEVTREMPATGAAALDASRGSLNDEEIAEAVCAAMRRSCAPQSDGKRIA